MVIKMKKTDKSATGTEIEFIPYGKDQQYFKIDKGDLYARIDGTNYSLMKKDFKNN